MGMNVGNDAAVRGEINITPLIDVVLVLLIIFMVVTPLLQVGYDVQVPPLATPSQPFVENQVIVRMDAEGRTFLNQRELSSAELGPRLAEAMAGRQDKVVFFAAEGGLEYGKVATFMDYCRDHGAENLGIVFDDLRS